MKKIVNTHSMLKSPYFYIDTDNQGHKFLKAFANIPASAVISLKEMGKNLIVRGNFKLSIRIGKSKFGQEVIFELLRFQDVKVEEALKNTHHDSVEIYLPQERGILFLEEAIDKINEFYKSEGAK